MRSPSGQARALPAFGADLHITRRPLRRRQHELVARMRRIPAEGHPRDVRDDLPEQLQLASRSSEASESLWCQGLVPSVIALLNSPRQPVSPVLVTSRKSLSASASEAHGPAARQTATRLLTRGTSVVAYPVRPQRVAM